MSTKTQNPAEQTKKPATEDAKITSTEPKKDELSEKDLGKVVGGRIPPCI